MTVTEERLPELLTLREVAGLLRVSMRTLERLVERGALPVVRPTGPNGNRRIRREALRAYLDALEVEGGES